MSHSFKDYLQLMIDKGASDLLLLGGYVPSIRIDGDLVNAEGLTALTGPDLEKILKDSITEKRFKEWKEKKELDFATGIGETARFRVNLYFQRSLPAAAIRRIPFEIPDPEAMGLPTRIFQELIKRPHGLILVTGPTGSGKSTTLATMINMLNQMKPYHIITIEDPIEYLHTPKRSVFSQREIGEDTADFNIALKYVLRQNPNVVLIGEMRDWETMQSAITVAETGHLVFATLHTNNAVQTVDRIIDVFPAHQQNQVRSQLAAILEAVISQQLLKKNGGGRVPGLEILLPNTAIRNLIREGKTHQLYSQMQVGQSESGMQTMTQSLAKLVSQNLITPELAMERCPNPQELAAWIGRNQPPSKKT